MSGGSLNYAYRHIEELACELDSNDKTVLQRAFAKHLYLVAKAAHDIEWVDSGDYGKGDDEKAIKAVLSINTENFQGAIIKSDVEQLIEKLQKFIAQ